MLLGNDAVEGSQVKTIRQADDVFLLAKRHLERLQTAFGIAHAGHATKEQSLDVSEAFRGQLARLIPPYLAIGDALAGDDIRNLAAPIGQLNSAIGAIDSQSLSDAALKRWLAEQKSLLSIADRLVKANDISALRSSFALLSDQLLTLQRTFGIQNSDQLFELHCPMAFEGRGASWIQADTAVRNPYYGATMLKCADRVEPLTGHAH